MIRTCSHCGALIIACMGFVKAGDIIEIQNGKRKDVRELCGKCAAPALLLETSEELRSFLMQIGWFDPRHQ